MATKPQSIEFEFEKLQSELAAQQAQLAGVDQQIAENGNEQLAEASANDFSKRLALRRSLQIERLAISDSIGAIENRLKRLEADLIESRKAARLRELEKAIAQSEPVFHKTVETLNENRQVFIDSLRGVSQLAGQLNELYSEKSSLAGDRQQRLFCDVPSFVELPTVAPSDGHWRLYAICNDELNLF